jgi:hypothetical protein
MLANTQGANQESCYPLSRIVVIIISRIIGYTSSRLHITLEAIIFFGLFKIGKHWYMDQELEVHKIALWLITFREAQPQGM